ncbi:MAG: hypothetical protein LBQ60_05030 [Bacteroidales bacterium]|jgi:DUF4097 and DUF4098 domain-containing protein YvlB|nr:hypothetical protein [Bacteroidales bacterium]
MKKLLVLLISVLLSANLFSQDNCRIKSYSIPEESVREVKANTVNGNITVNGNAISEVIVEMCVSQNNKRQNNKEQNVEIWQMLEELYTIDIRIEGGKLYAVAKRKDEKNSKELNISFKISVPQKIDGDLRTINGSLKVENVSGKIVGNTVNGSIDVSNADTDIVMKTVNGNITAKDCNGKIVLNTVNGNVNTSKMKGDISATTVNGKVNGKSPRFW